jgi:starch phosphorylase
MNGAITLGTDDGANVEIRELVGDENIKIFGLTTPEVDKLRAEHSYWAWDAYNADRARLGRLVDMLTNGQLAKLSGNFESVYDGLMVNNDYDLVLKDFYSYVQAWEELTKFYASDRTAWNRSAVHNTAKSGYFSSDRTIRDYDADIWHSLS